MQATGQVKSVTMWEEAYPSKSVIVLLSGKAGVGKTYIADKLISLFKKSGYIAHIRSFADGIKDCAIDYFNWDSEKNKRGRKLLQNIGNIGREYDKDVWVKRLVRAFEDNIYLYDVYVVDDWRFENERDYLEKLNDFYIIAVRVESNIRGGLQGDLAEDVSENSLPEDLTYYDFIVENNEEDLTESLKLIINYIDKMEVKDG